MIATIAIGSSPFRVVVNLAGTRAYVSTQSSAVAQFVTVSVIDTAANTVAATIAVGYAPHGVAVNAGGDRIYVANIGGTVSVIRL